MEEPLTKIDLHIHSCYSKNTWNTKFFMPPSRSRPEQILKMAQKKGLHALAITDHDNIKGSMIAHRLAKKYAMIAIPSVEVSSSDGHLLALNVKEDITKGKNAEDT